MEIASRKLGEFFNIGRDKGWDVARQVWTVHSLVDPEGRVAAAGESLQDMEEVIARLAGATGSRPGG